MAMPDNRVNLQLGPAGRTPVPRSAEQKELALKRTRAQKILADREEERLQKMWEYNYE